MTTLSDLRALLERSLVHADNPAILRLPERTVEGLARAYLPRIIYVKRTDGRVEQLSTEPALKVAADVFHPCYSQWLGWVLTDSIDLTDPGTTHALLVAWALALGLDPGVGGLACMWVRDEPGWSIVVERGDIRFTDPLAIRRRGDPTQITACHVAREPDPIKALALAVRHVLEAP